MSCSSQPVEFNCAQAEDVAFLVQRVITSTKNAAETDEFYRSCRNRVGQRLEGTGRILTLEAWQAAQRQCRDHWARVTPSHVSLLSRSLLNKSDRWEDISKRLENIKVLVKKTGEFSFNGCTLSREDILEVERCCRDTLSTTQANEIVKFVLKQKTCSSTESAKIFDQLRCRGQYYMPDAIDKAERECVEYFANRGKEHEIDATRLQSSRSGLHVAGSPRSRSPARRVHRLQVKRCEQNTNGTTMLTESTPENNPHAFRRRLRLTSKAEDSFQFKDDDGDLIKLTRVDGDVRVTVPRLGDVGLWEGFDRESGEYSAGDVLGTVPAESIPALQAFLKVLPENGSDSSAAPTVQDSSSLAGETSATSPSTRRKPAQKVDNVAFLVQSVFDRTSANEHAKQNAKEYLRTLKSRIGLPIPEADGREFTEKDIDKAWRRIDEAFSETVLPADETIVDSSSGDCVSVSSSSSVGGKYTGGRRPRGRGRRTKRTNKDLDGTLDADSEAFSDEESLDQEARVDGNDTWIDLASSVDDYDKLDDDYPIAAWGDEMPSVLPGHDGFNDRATAVMRKIGVGAAKSLLNFDAHSTCPPLQPHQESVKFLLHPMSPVTRLLVDHPTGSGKTREMIAVLDNFFFDPRPKVPIFPKEAVCRNFYEELLRWPSRYRDYFACEKPEEANAACGKRDWRKYRSHIWPLEGFSENVMQDLRTSIRDVLEMKYVFFNGRASRGLRRRFRRQHPGEHMPVAPLRALRYVSAGGAFSGIGENNMPNSALMKIGYSRGDGNVYSNKVVLMDEAHNLVRTHPMYGKQLDNLRKLLLSAKNLVLAGFTGTPILNEPNEGRKLLDIIKGSNALGGDEGFLSSFPMRPQPLFPKSLPRGVPDEVLTLKRRRQLVKKVELRGEAFKVYDFKLREGYSGRRLRTYCNVSRFSSTFHDGLRGTKTAMLSNPQDCCPKIFAIAQAIASSPQKSVILIHASSGYKVMVDVLKLVAERASPPFGVATMNEFSDFNNVSNFRGERFRVLVADAEQCSEGVNFLNVRRTFLADVPVTPSAFIQQCGRAIRMYGHRDLPEEERDVTTHLYVAVLPKWLRSSTLACWAMRLQRQRKDFTEMEKEGKILTARFNRVDIRSLAELKTRIEKFALSKQEHGTSQDAQRDDVTKKYNLSQSDVAEFFEQIDLQDEAEQLQKTCGREARLDDMYDASSDIPPDGRIAALSWAIDKLNEFLEGPGFMDSLLHSNLLDGERRDLTDRKLRCLYESSHIVPIIDKIVSTLPEEERGGFSHWTHGQLEYLQEDLLELRAKEEAASTRPRGRLFRAVRELNSASSAEEPSLSRSLRLSIATADEEALEQLSEKSKEFVAALGSLRSRAVDHELFQKLAEPIEKDASDEMVTESEVSDLEKELRSYEFILPKGWRSELVARAKGQRKVRVFINLKGVRYEDSKAMRTHLMHLHRRENEVAANRARLRGKHTPPAESDPVTPRIAAAMEFSRASTASAPKVNEHNRLVGVNVVIHGLVQLAQYNGRKGFLVRFLEEKGRWQCRLEDGAQINLKPDNFKFLHQVRDDHVSMKGKLDTINHTIHEDSSTEASASQEIRMHALETQNRNIRRRCKGPETETPSVESFPLLD